MLFGAVSIGISDESRDLFSPTLGGFVALSIVLLFLVVELWLVKKSMARSKQVSALRDLVRLTDADRERILQKRELRALQVNPFIFAYLRHLGATQLDFDGKPHEAERLTLFLHDSDAKAFVPICRHSNSAEFSKIVPRTYPEHEGCLGRAWKQGVYRSRTYPDPASVDSYIAQSESDGFPTSRFMGLRMVSRVYCGTVIWSAERNQPIGFRTICSGL